MPGTLSGWPDAIGSTRSAPASSHWPTRSLTTTTSRESPVGANVWAIVVLPKMRARGANAGATAGRSSRWS